MIERLDRLSNRIPPKDRIFVRSPGTRRQRGGGHDWPAELYAMKSALAVKLPMRQAAERAAIMALDRLPMILALFAAHDTPTPP